MIDASQGRDGRELVDPRLRDLDAEVRLPRTSEEARTNVRYFDALGYRVIVAGPQARAAAQATGVAALRVAGLPQALEAARDALRRRCVRRARVRGAPLTAPADVAALDDGL